LIHEDNTIARTPENKKHFFYERNKRSVESSDPSLSGSHHSRAMKGLFDWPHRSGRLAIFGSADNC
jgi:hypothetical protein